MRETLTDLLDALAIVLFGIGLGFQATGWAGVITSGPAFRTAALIGVGITVAGMTIGLGSWFASRPPRPPQSGAD